MIAKNDLPRLDTTFTRSPGLSYVLPPTETRPAPRNLSNEIHMAALVENERRRIREMPEAIARQHGVLAVANFLVKMEQKSQEMRPRRRAKAG